MTTTTIKVTTELRDRLKAQAAAAGRTLGGQIEFLAGLGARDERMADLRRAIARTDPDAMRSYEVETAAWDAIEAGGSAA